MTTLTISTVEELQETVRATRPGTRLLPVGNRTKPGLSSFARDDVEFLCVNRLTGVVDYDPAELTLTALAGTPVAEVQALLDKHHQYLPFDPPLADAGATVGGSVAAGLSGSGAWRHGGVRDFVIGIRFIDGTGRLISGGARVVKNAAGFDLPKLLVGSIGRLGVIVEVSFKVFPKPGATTTLVFALDTFNHAIEASLALARSPIQLEALDIGPTNQVLARVAGRAEALESRVSRLASTVTAPATRREGADERALWHDAAELRWPAADTRVIYAGLSIKGLAQLHEALNGVPGAVLRAGVGGTVAWIAWLPDQPAEHLHKTLTRLGISGMVVLGPPDRPRLGLSTGGEFAQRIIRAIDPDSRFLEL